MSLVKRLPRLSSGLTTHVRFQRPCAGVPPAPHGSCRALHRTAPTRRQEAARPESAAVKKDPLTKEGLKSLTKEELVAYEDGSHPNLHTPYEVTEGQSLRVSKFAAPGSGHIRVLTLNEPATFNALSKNMITELTAEVDSVHQAPSTPDIRALIIASDNVKAFCAGANLKERASMTTAEVSSILTRMRSCFTRLEELPVPCISAVQGLALGGGLELALTAHLRVFASTALVGLPETGLGIIPGAGGTHRLPRLVGRSRALDVMLTGRRLSGRDAFDWGIANRLVDVASAADAPKAVLQEALTLAARISAKAPLATRAVLRAVSDKRGDQSAENDAYNSILETEDRVEALLAFREKRPPVWRGR